MKKFYLALLTAIISAAFGFKTVAEEYSITIQWETPGQVKIAINNVMQTLPDGATSFVAKTDTYYSAQIYAADGYLPASCTGSDGLTINMMKSYSTPPQLYFQIPIKNNNGKTYTVTTKPAVNDRTFKLNVVNGADKIRQLSVGNLALDTFTKGETEHSFCSAFGNTCSLSFDNSITPYNVEFNGTKITPFYGQYRNINFTADTDVLTIQIYEDGKEPVEEKCTVTLDLKGKAEQALKNIFNNSLLKEVTPTDGTFEVSKGNHLTFYFNEDFDITSFKAGEENVTLAENRANVTINANTTIAIDATDKVYSTEMFTAYIVCPEGVELWQGNALNGERITLPEGEVVNEEISFPKTKEQDAYTIPAGQAIKYEIPVSSKYGSINVMDKEGYWVRQKREGNLSGYALNPITSKTFYIVSEKVENDTKAVVYLHGEANAVSLTPYNLYGADQKRSIATEGYSTISFDSDYENPFSILTTSTINSLSIIFNGAEISANDEGQMPAITLTEGSLLEVIVNERIPAKKTLTFTKEDGADATLKYDIAPMTIDFAAPMQCYEGTKITLTPDAGTIVTLNDTALTPDSEGNCTFTVADDCTIALTAAAAPSYVLSPADGETVSSLNKITISFPSATTVTRSADHSDDEAMLKTANWSYHSMGVSCTAVEGAEYPTFEFQFEPKPSTGGEYILVIAEGYFTVDGEASPDIMSTFTIEGGAPVEVNWYAPLTTITTGEYAQAIIEFDWGTNVSIADPSLISVKLNDVEAEASSYQIIADENMFGVMFENLAETGTLKLAAEAGALTINGTPSPAIENSWNVIVAKDYTMQFTPAAGTEDAPTKVGSLAEITIVFPEADKAELFNEYGVRLSNKKYDATQYNEMATVTAVEGAEHPTFKLTFAKAATYAGKYTLSIGWGAFTLDGAVEFEGTDAYYELDPNSGIDAIIVADGEAKVYNLQGMPVNGKWAELPAGIYIVDGKKVVK